MAGRPKKNPDNSVIAKEKKTGVPKMQNPPPPPPKAIYLPEHNQYLENNKDFVFDGKTIEKSHSDLFPPKEPDLKAIIAKYEQLCIQQSDINELLPIIREVASHCDHCTEFGVRNPTSTYAILAGNPKKLVSYDIVRHENVAQVEALAPNFEFILGNSLDVDIEETDMLMIDTHHRYTQLRAELALHSDKVRKYLIFHDVETYGRIGESFYEEQPFKMFDGNDIGLMPAIQEFLQQGDFVIDFHARYNNGLMILRRVK